MEADFTRCPWQLRYSSSDLNAQGEPTDVLRDFYLPALSRAITYDRVAGYFRSSSLAAASQGYTAFFSHGGTMRLIVGADLHPRDVAAVLRGDRQRLAQRLMEALDRPHAWPDAVQNGVSLLCQMVAAGRLEIRVAFRRSAATGRPLTLDDPEGGYVHEKWFLMGDAQGNRLYGSGSLNESRTALTLNAENIDLHWDWEGGRDWQRVELAHRHFCRLWDNELPHMAILPLPQAVRSRLVSLKTLRRRPVEVDGTSFRREIRPTVKELLAFALLQDAPKLPGGGLLGMYSAPVAPWPHQEAVIRRLVERWPCSYLLCDEVGLGKTVEAALALRCLVLSGRVKRVLIAAPAGLTGQWHRELAQKAMLPFAKSTPKSGGAIQHQFLLPQPRETSDQNLLGPALNLVSSALLCREERIQALQAAEDYDVVLADEAHYARRHNPQDGASAAPDYGRLYTVFRDALRPKAKSMWLATATPMQIDPIEVYDLLCLTRRTGPYQADPTLTAAYFSLMDRLVRREKLTPDQWALLGKSFHQLEALDPFLWEELNRTFVTGKNRAALEMLPHRPPKQGDIPYLTQPLFAASPLSRVMMRHTRSLLELYRQKGELKGRLARRCVRPLRTVSFTPAEAGFYARLNDYCQQLERRAAQDGAQVRQRIAFLLNFLQLRFASSLYAVQMTLARRLRRVDAALHAARPQEEDWAPNTLLQLLREDDYAESDLDAQTVELLLRDRSRPGLEWERRRLTQMLTQLQAMQETPSKIQTLLEELDRRRSGGRLRQTVLFTRFLDTAISIRRHLLLRDPNLRAGIYAGSQAQWYDPALKKDQPVSHLALKRLFLQGEVDLLLCTDAAAEGLNLQTADLLINFDLGWNPVKVEQRIGRIDRIGQKHDCIEVLNLCYLGSVEEAVYGRLFARLQSANLVVGQQQISILPVEAGEFRALQNGTLDEETLARRSLQRLQHQRDAAAAMELSPESQYNLYQTDRVQAVQDRPSACLEDLWAALTQSPYLQSLGAFCSGPVWRLPETPECPALEGTIQRDAVTERVSFLTWGNPGVDRLLALMAEKLPPNGPVRRICIHSGGVETVGYLVSVRGGTRLITALSQLDGLCLETGGVISDEEAAAAEEQLAVLAAPYAGHVRLAEQAEGENLVYARLEDRLLHTIACSLLQQEWERGVLRFSDALRHLEETAGEIRHLPLPAAFSGVQAKLLFPISEQSGSISVPVHGLPLRCALDCARRAASSLSQRRGAPLTTEAVLRRLSRDVPPAP